MREHYFEDVLEPILKGTILNIVLFLRERGLLISHFRCPVCIKYTKEVETTRNNDKRAFRCMNVSCTNYKYFYSIRTNSFFANYKISLKHCLTLMWKWAGELTTEEILREVNVSNQVAIKFFKDLRALCKTYFERNPVRLGGDSIVCQVDESLFRHKPKYHRGRATEHELWVFGIADTSYSPAKIFLRLVEDKSTASLIPLIYDVCRPGTMIVSDEWAAYNFLVASNTFQHMTVNHSLHFIDPVTRVHTQNIESYWAKAKYRIKMKKGVYGTLLESYLDEFMFKDNVMRGDFQVLIDLIKFNS